MATMILLGLRGGGGDFLTDLRRAGQIFLRLGFERIPVGAILEVIDVALVHAGDRSLRRQHILAHRVEQLRRPHGRVII